MTLRITFLGTSGAVPTTERSSSGIFVNIHGDKFLFDA
ncbi:MAG TPA: ribonuclease Z, partial [Halobacteriales archaeon]|nr:ribonuclease Z [Halobacteriales archaeon]